MKKFFVIGNNTTQSLSPTIFNYWFKKYNIDAKYGHMELNNKNFVSQIKKTLSKKDVIGLNITIPFKSKIIKYIDSCDKHSRKINAVNCLTKKLKTKGFNTDWTGYYNSLPRSKKLKTKNILIIGYGGAALAIHYVLKIKGFKKITIINRSKRKIKFQKKPEYTKPYSNLEKLLPSADLIINTTPINPINKKMKKLIKKTSLLSDINYRPKETSFLKEFKENKKIYGISMLLNQASESFVLWFGFKPKTDPKLLKILENKIK